MTFLAQNNTFVSEIRKYPDRWPDFGTDVEVALKCDRQQCEKAASVDTSQPLEIMADKPGESLVKFSTL